MAQLVACPECKKPLQVPDDLLGKNVQCPECKHTFTATLSEPAEEKSRTATTTSPATPLKKPAWEKKSNPMDESTPSKRRRDRDDNDEDDDDEEEERSDRRSRRRRTSVRGNYMPHRGGMILAFGIIGLVAGIPVFGLLAWILGNSDLKEMQAGRMDPEGEGMTQTGRILGMISTILWIIALVALAGFFGLCICLPVVGGLAGAGANQRRR